MTELLEMQGLTPDMVRDYLRGKGWTRFEMTYAKPSGVQVFWRHPTDSWSPADTDITKPWFLEQVAKMEHRHIQEVAAEMNPRLRPGLPSDTAVYRIRPWAEFGSDTMANWRTAARSSSFRASDGTRK